MKSLNRSLPSARSSRPSPPEDLLPAFKQAALSVTQLYKSAASYQDSIRQAGYQDALDDLLKFLDREHLGLQDGEGWRVREWATARYDVSHLQPESDEDEGIDVEQEPVEPTTESNNQEQVSQEEELPQQATDPIPSSSQDQSEESSRPIFRFTAAPDHSMQTDTPHESKPQPVRMEVVNRTNRNTNRHNTRHMPRSTNRINSQIAGSKRKVPFPDFAEIFGFDKKDNQDGGSSGGGGSKRSRLA